jgi:hypothetical protein
MRSGWWVSVNCRSNSVALLAGREPSHSARNIGYSERTRIRIPRVARAFKVALSRRSLGLSTPLAIKRGVQFHKALMLSNPFPRFRRGPEATYRGWVASRYDDLNAKGFVFQPNDAIGRLSVRMCPGHTLHMVCPALIGNQVKVTGETVAIRTDPIPRFALISRKWLIQSRLHPRPRSCHRYTVSNLPTFPGCPERVG